MYGATNETLQHQSGTGCSTSEKKKIATGDRDTKPLSPTHPIPLRRSLASKGFPSGYSKCVCVRLHSKTPNLRCGCLKGRLTNTPRRHRVADGQLPSLDTPSPRFSSFGAASVILSCFRSSCHFERTLTAVCELPEYRSGRN